MPKNEYRIGNKMDILHKVIKFTEEGLKHKEYATIAFDPDMQARVIEYTENSNGTVKVKLDMTEFIRFNEQHMIPDWEDRMGQKIFKWNQTRFYPSNQIAEVVFYKDHPPFELR